MNVDAIRTMIENNPPRQLVNELEPDSVTLKDMRDRFRESSTGIDILSVYETLETPTVVFDVRLRAITVMIRYLSRAGNPEATRSDRQAHDARDAAFGNREPHKRGYHSRKG
jgi:hypothetical protein